MAIVPIDNIGAVGLVRDSESRELMPEAWDSVRNVRFRNGIAETSHGEAQVFGALSVTPNWIMAADIGGVNYWFYANDTAIYRTDGTAHVDVTRLAGPYVAETNPQWNGCTLGGVPIVNNKGGIDYPQYYDSGTAKFADLTAWPANLTAKVIRSFKQFAIALNLTDSGTPLPFSLRWSHPADPGTVPSSWDITDPTKLTGQVPISETAGVLVDCLPLGDVNIVYKQFDTWVMQFTGGQQVFAFRKLFPEFGMIAQGCAANIPDGHFVVTVGDIVIHNGNSWESIATKRIRARLFNTLSSEFQDYTRVAVNEQFKEVWVFFTEEGATAPVATTALIWNWEDNTWTERDLPDVYYATTGIYTGDGNADTFDSAVGTIDSETALFDETNYPAIRKRLLMASAANSKCYIADQDFSFDGVAYTASLERKKLGIVGRDRQGNWKVDQEAVKFLRNLYLKFSSPNAVNVNVFIGVQLKPNASVSWQGPYTFDTMEDTTIYCTVTTKLISVRFEIASGQNCKFIGYDIDMDVTARY